MIIKRRVTKYFVQIANDVVRDKRLALDEHGMLHYLLSLPDDWEVNLRQIEAYWKIGKDKRQRIFRALRRTGWAQLERITTDEGVFVGQRWIIGDEPGPECSVSEAEEEDVEATEEATAAPESKGPDALVTVDREPPFPAVGSTGDRVSRQPEKAAPLLRRNSSEEQILDTNTTAQATKSISEGDDADDGEPPPRFGELLKLWPSENIASAFACEKAFAKFSDRQKLEAFKGIKPYLNDCRSKGQNRLCDFRTYLDERRFERFVGKGSVGKQLWVTKRGTAQAKRWREHYAKHEPKKLPIFEMGLAGQGYTTPSEWPPAEDPLEKSA